MPQGEVTWAATGDLNGDGYPEVAVAQASYVQVMVNHAGVLTAGVKYTVGNIHRVLVADVNRDGRLDIVAVGGLTAVLLGKGDGTMQTPKQLSGMGDDAALGDVNRDGYPDLVVANAAGVQVRLNDHQGGFGTAALVAAVSASRVEVADLDGDGNDDIVGINGNLLVMLGRGDGSSAALATTPASAASFAIGDANHDSHPDVFYAGNGSAGVLLGNGDGSFRLGSTLQVGNGQALSLGDFNSDGTLDMAVSAFALNEYAMNVPAGLTVLHGNGDGTFHAGKSYAFGGAQNPAVDMNGDGHLDLVIGGVAIAFGNGDASFRAIEQVNAGTAGSKQIVNGDFRHDGSREFAVIGQGGQIRVMSESNRQWTKADISGFAGYTLASGDFDGDGNLDLAAITQDGFVAVANGNGNLSFNVPKKSPAGTSTAKFLAAGRLNGDRLDDVVLGSGGTLQLLLASGSGYFVAPIGLTLQNGDAVGSRLIDLNLDGIGDIMVQHDYGFTVLLGDANGKYLDQRYIDAAGKIGGFLLQDLNGDAKPDLVYTTNLLGKVYVSWGDGAGNFSAGGVYPVLLPSDVTAGDINGDRFPDLIIGTDNGGLATLLGTAQHTFSTVSYWYANVGQSAPIVADVTADGVPDVVTLDDSGAISLFENRGFTQVLSPSAAISASVLDFGSQTIRRESAGQKVTLTNTGNLDLSLRLFPTGDFTESDACGHELRVGAACVVNFTFKPIQVGMQSTAVPIAADLSSTLTLQGMGLDITTSGSRPSRDTRPAPAPVAPPTAAKSAMPAAKATPVLNRRSVSRRRKLPPHKLPLRHPTW
jgi:hypothetical protein